MPTNISPCLFATTLQQRQKMDFSKDRTGSTNLTESDKAHIEFMKMTKVAIATAIIRSKPENMTGEQYATFLHQKIQMDRDNWEQKCKSLERELLFMKTKVLSKNIEHDENYNSNIVNVSYLPTTPPSSSEKVEANKTLFSDEKILYSHVTFLDCVSKLNFDTKFIDRVTDCCLGKISDCADVSEDIIRAKIVNEQTLNSVEKILNFVKRKVTFGNKLLIPFDTILFTVSSVIKLLSSLEKYLLSSSDEDRIILEIATSIVEKCCNLSLELQAHIMSASSIESYEMQNACCKVINHLATCSSFCPTIVRQLVRGIVAVSLHLKASLTEPNTVDEQGPPTWILCENVAYLFKMLESTLLHLLENIECLANKECETVIAQPIILDDQSAMTVDTNISPGENEKSKSINQKKLTNVTTSKKQKQEKKNGPPLKKAKTSKENISGNIIDFSNSVKSSQQQLKNTNINFSQQRENAFSSSKFGSVEADSVCRKSSQIVKAKKEREEEHIMNSIVSVITPDFLSYIQEAMDNSLFYICDDFPLFAFYVWKISGLVERILKVRERWL